MARNPGKKPVVFIVPVGTEWNETLLYFGLGAPSESASALEKTPYGKCFERLFDLESVTARAIFMMSGCGKVRAAGAAQFAISKWKPAGIVNIGTCGGFSGSIEKGDLMVAERAVAYDVRERMGDPDEMIRQFSTDLDLSFVSENIFKAARKRVIASADADLDPAQIPWLRERYGAVAADWESAAIAKVASLNGVRAMILRGVSDLVCQKEGGEAYGNYQAFAEGARPVMKKILDLAPETARCIIG